MSDWRCGTCQAMNDEAAVVCEQCAGHPAPRLTGPARWQEPCPEPGCPLTVGEHRDAVRRLMAEIERKRVTVITP